MEGKAGMVGDLIMPVSACVATLAASSKDGELERTKDEVIYMIDVGLLFAGKKCAEDVKNIARVDERGTVMIGIDSTLKYVDFPPRHGIAEECAGWNDLPEELKNKIHDFVLVALTDRSQLIDTTSALAWTLTSREIHREFTDILYSTIKLQFVVVDFDFAEVIHFITSISTAACHALLKNNNLHATMIFSTDSLCDWMIRGTMEWLRTCKYITNKLERKPFNGVRIPWNYHARGDDDIVHMEWEIEVVRWTKRFYEWDNELTIMKECFQQAPLLV